MSHPSIASDTAVPAVPCILQQSADYECRLSLRPLATPAHHSELLITSVWGGAREPLAEQVRFRAVLDTQGLRRLQSSLEAHLSAETPQSSD